MSEPKPIQPSQKLLESIKLLEGMSEIPMIGRWTPEDEAELAAAIEKMVDSIPGEHGWWKSHARDKYLKAAKSLRSEGWGIDETEEFLSGLYWAAANCFGG